MASASAASAASGSCEVGISGLIRRRRGKTTIRVPGVRVCEDLVDRQFAAEAPNRVWVADVAYLRTWQGWLYLVAIQDLCSRRIVGWSMADHMRNGAAGVLLGRLAAVGLAGVEVEDPGQHESVASPDDDGQRVREVAEPPPRSRSSPASCSFRRADQRSARWSDDAAA